MLMNIVKGKKFKPREIDLQIKNLLIRTSAVFDICFPARNYKEMWQPSLYLVTAHTSNRWVRLAEAIHKFNTSDICIDPEINLDNGTQANCCDMIFL